jgi:transcriptional regulator with XRE-family HTH domain
MDTGGWVCELPSMIVNAPPPSAAETDGFAALLRQYRGARRMSQLDLALACAISARHLSFLETGRARPSREMVLQLGEGLVLPLAGRNRLLLAAGFAAVYPASPLASEALAPFRAVLNEMIDRHAPYPAMLCDRHWNILEANAPARSMLAPLHGAGMEMNIVRMLTESALAATLIANLPDVIREMRGRIALETLEAGPDPVLIALLAELDPAAGLIQRQPIVPLVLNTPTGPLRFLSTIAHFATSEDITVRDLRLELLFPADDATRRHLQASATA